MQPPIPAAHPSGAAPASTASRAAGSATPAPAPATEAPYDRLKALSDRQLVDFYMSLDRITQASVRGVLASNYPELLARIEAIIPLPPPASVPPDATITAQGAAPQAAPTGAPVQSPQAAKKE